MKNARRPVDAIIGNRLEGRVPHNFEALYFLQNSHRAEDDTTAELDRMQDSDLRLEGCHQVIDLSPYYDILEHVRF